MASHQIDLPASTVSIPAGAATEAKQDAANALLTSIDSKSNLPVKFNKDGTPTVVNYDTATPSSSEALPVNIVTVNGQSISTTVDLSGSQINVQLSDRGTSPDSVKIGDGVEYLAINANNEATVHDADILAAIGLLAKLTDTQPVSLASAPLPTDAATATNQSSILTALASLLTELQLKADLLDTQPVNVQNASLAVTGTFWQATQPVSLASVPTHAVTQSGVWTVNATPPAQAGSFDEDATVSTTPETFTAPAGAFACFIEADDTNTTNARVKMNGTATTSSGIQFQPGRSEFYQGGSDISYCMESGTGKLSVQWFTR